MSRRCAVCEKPGSACSGCAGDVAYCGRECQRADWLLHSPMCWGWQSSEAVKALAALFLDNPFLQGLFVTWREQRHPTLLDIQLARDRSRLVLSVGRLRDCGDGDARDGASGRDLVTLVTWEGDERRARSFAITLGGHGMFSGLEQMATTMLPYHDELKPLLDGKALVVEDPGASTPHFKIVVQEDQ